jgi:ATP-dependent helicase/nuclease subunit B
MAVHLYIAPAAAGKTAYLVALARDMSRGLASPPRVVVPTRLQARGWRRRLAQAGGTVGVRVDTFDGLYRDVLRHANAAYARLSDPVQYRLVRMVIEQADLRHYAPLRPTPGFVLVVLDVIRELKAGGIFPEAFASAVAAMGGERRLTELAEVYLAYQQRLQTERWADFAGLGWLAAEALEVDHDLLRDDRALFIDGFDDLTTVQQRVLAGLAARTPETVITLTGAAAGGDRDPVHRRFNRTRRRLESLLGVEAEPLPGLAYALQPSRSPAPDAQPPAAEVCRDNLAPPLAYLEATVLAGSDPLPGDAPAVGDAVTLIAAPDREGEVRAALRWLKMRLVEDGLALSDVALLARKVTPYRPLIRQIAGEFGLPIHLVEGLPLRTNPAVRALLDLLRLPIEDDGAFPWRLTVEAWRSPYFDWRSLDPADGAEPAQEGSESYDRVRRLDLAARLDLVARWGSVVGGLDQWREAFSLLAEAEPRAGSVDDPDVEVVRRIGSVRELQTTFDRFAARITPPQGIHACRDFVAWMEALIGDIEPPETGVVTDLGVARRALAAPEPLANRDLAALNALKDVLRGLVWAEEAVACEPVSYARFYADLVGAIEAATYNLPLPSKREALLVVGVPGARGLSFRAVAVLGLAEGEFPATLSEDPLLRDRDRVELRDQHGLALELSTDSAEAGYFYEAMTRPTDKLLLTRPRIADNGAPWEPSPYWEEVRGRLALTPLTLTSGDTPPPGESASVPELWVGVARSFDDGPVIRSWAAGRGDDRWAALAQAARILRRRSAPASVDAGSGKDAAFDGDLTPWSWGFARRFGPACVWSASRIETYRGCPFHFFVDHVLKLEPRRPPLEGLDARQVGNLYHHILEALYQAVDDPTDVPSLEAALPAVAGPILDAAPRREGFRPTAWWEQTRAEILANVRRSVAMLHDQRQGFAPYAYEAAFGLAGEPVLVIGDDEGDGRDHVRLRGYIDRVDRAEDGRVCVIDYKTAGKSAFTRRAVVEGKKVQLPLYALAAQEALGLGPVVDGFYWHVRQAERSSLRLARFEGGPDAAMEVAAGHTWEAVRGARAGRFVPKPPDGGCPDYCPAVAFCWRYTPRFG